MTESERDTGAPKALLFKGYIRQVGGGEVAILVDRETESYPHVGERVAVHVDPAPDRHRRGILELRLATFPRSYYEIVQWYKTVEHPGDHCFTVAYWNSDKDGITNLKFVARRPLDVPDHDAFWELVKLGYPLAEMLARESVE